MGENEFIVKSSFCKNTSELYLVTNLKNFIVLDSSDYTLKHKINLTEKFNYSFLKELVKSISYVDILQLQSDTEGSYLLLILNNNCTIKISNRGKLIMKMFEGTYYVRDGLLTCLS